MSVFLIEPLFQHDVRVANTGQLAGPSEMPNEFRNVVQGQRGQMCTQRPGQMLDGALQEPRTQVLGHVAFGGRKAELHYVVAEKYAMAAIALCLLPLVGVFVLSNQVAYGVEKDSIHLISVVD